MSVSTLLSAVVVAVVAALVVAVLAASAPESVAAAKQKNTKQCVASPLVPARGLSFHGHG